MIYPHELELKSSNPLFTVLEHIPNKQDYVKFALFCAKDCFHFNNDITKNAAQNCINLIEQWLKDNTSVTYEMVQNAHREAYNILFNPTQIISRHSLHAAMDAVWSVFRPVYTEFPAINSSKAYTTDRDQKYKQYFAYALSLLRSSDIVPSCRGSIPDRVTLMALLDELGELGENIVLPENDFFKLNMANGMDIIGRDMDELTEQVWNNAAALHYLEKLYR